MCGPKLSVSELTITWEELGNFAKDSPFHLISNAIAHIQNHKRKFNNRVLK